MQALATKPRLRGVSHQVAAFAAPAAGVGLVGNAGSARAAFAAAVYAAALGMMFAVSALYHRRSWRPAAYLRMRRLDHAAIFIIIAGTYTPLCLLAIRGAAGTTLLVLVWAGAAAGVLQAMFWTHAPRAVAVSLYCALGWIAVGFASELYAAIGTTGALLLGLGGVLYTAGAIIYALRRPDPHPSVFGYHEVFHALVIVASVCHFIVVATSVVRG